MECRQFTTYTAGDSAILKSKIISVTAEADEPVHLESGVINLYPELTFQTIEGFGGAMTEASAYLLSKLDPEKRKKFYADYFGKTGNRYRYIRVPMDSCDFSLSEYAAVEDPLADPELLTFSIKRDRQYILPFLKEAIAAAAEPISVLLSPWSPPAAWKTPPVRPKNDQTVYGALPGHELPVDYETPSRCNGGSLKPEFYASWADYLCKYAAAYLAEGIPVTMMSLQNETIAATNWDSCVWTATEQKSFLRDYLYPGFVKYGLANKIGLYVWDHNKERVYEFSREILDDLTSPMVEGIAFHWYSGDHFEALALTSQAFPGKVLLSSECCGLHEPGKVGFMGLLGNKLADTVEYEDAVAYAHDLIGNLNHGMNRWIDWNLMVDQNGGPRHVPSGFAAPVVYQENGTYRKTLTFEYIRHFASYIHPDAKRIGYSLCDDQIEMTAALNQDRSIAVVLLNKQNADAKYAIRIQGQIIRIELPAKTLTTLQMI